MTNLLKHWMEDDKTGAAKLRCFPPGRRSKYERTNNISQLQKPNIDKRRTRQDLSGRICVKSFIFLSLKSDKTRKLCTFSLFIVQCTGGKHWFFYLMNILKYITVNSGLDRSFKEILFQRENLEYWDNSILTAQNRNWIGLSAFRFGFRRQNVWNAKMTHPTQVKSCHLTIKRKNQARRAKRYEFEYRSMSRQTPVFSTFCRPYFHFLDGNFWFSIEHSIKSRMSWGRTLNKKPKSVFFEKNDY